jgi:hypothetical protein
MRRSGRTLLGTAIAAAIAVVIPLMAQQPYVEGAPTEKDPLRFSAFAVNMQGGRAGAVDIAIERWSTDAERETLVEFVKTAKVGEPGQSKLLEALQKIKPRCGFIRTPNSMGWDIKYARENKLADGTRQIVIATDKPVSFLAAASQARTMDYPFSLVEMRFPPGTNKGEGKLLAQTSISVQNGKLELEIYGQEPTRLTTITEQKPKKKS